MIRHIVMWRLKEQAEGASKEENAARIKAVLEGLKPVIRQIRSLEVGIDISRTESSYDVALVTEFESLADLKAYATHPEHVKAAGFIGKVCSARVLADYEA